MPDGRHPNAGSGEGQDRLVAAALADPVRAKVYTAVGEVAFAAEEGAGGRPGAARGISVRGISERVGEHPRRVRYHLDVLCELGLIEVADKRRRRAVLERLFAPTRMPVLSYEEIEGLPPSQQAKILLGCVKAIFRDTTAAIKSGSAIERPDWVASHVVGHVDREGWRALAARHGDFVLEVTDLLAESRERMAATGERPIRVLSANLFLELPPSDSPDK
jgi:DNA-binding transcriptional ArsR family regulator